MNAPIDLPCLLYAPQKPSTEQLREAARGLLAQMEESERRPSAGGYVALASNLHGAAQLALALLAELREVAR